MRKDNYAYFVSNKGEPRDIGSKILEECGTLPNFENLKKGIVQKSRKGNQYHFILPIGNEFQASLGETTKDIKLAILSLHSMVKELNIKSISIAKSPHINNVLWEEISATLKIVFLYSTIKIIICNGITQYPTKEQGNQSIEEAHSSAIRGHKGVTKTYNRIRQRYYWENMKLDIQKYIQLCLQCQLKKLVRVKTKNAMIITDSPGTAFEKISMDIFGKLPATLAQNQYILTIQDKFTKYSLAIPLPNHQAGTIADAFIKKFICIYASPKAVLTDQGADFLSNLMRRMAKRFRIRQFKTTVYHPQSNGSLKRSHHVIKEYFKQFIENNAEWDDWIELAMFSYKTSVHEGTKCTPYELVFGKLARLPSCDPLSGHEGMETYDMYMTKLITKLHEMRGIARQNLIAAIEKLKEYYDIKINPQNFKIGVSVFLLEGGKLKKFENQYSGPYEVREILGK